MRIIDDSGREWSVQLEMGLFTQWASGPREITLPDDLSANQLAFVLSKIV